ncbi:LysE family translocator [Rhodobium gokarnense]|uniref:Threonine/homoserine/homoserine lactone efflux protein n=1 Tax=Rhodobium gokarnense TaxID=364296 RepID=A0ABT3H5X7_9HYPH|nr:LysE family translocator [Rhodobium gokarnense]MCW2305759.1 threonine/homoserine/homoserine lactone efflux protein [Rhodobium gokarnense]
MSPEFLVTSFVVVLAPGTGVLFTLAMGLSKGVRASIAAAFGCTLGIVPHMAAAILGLAALLHASATAFQMLKIAGVIYLLYLAWTMLKERGALSVPPEEEAREEAARHGGIVVKAILINILNPKLSIFFLAFLPQFIDPDAAGATASMVFLSAIFMAMTFVVFVGYGVFAATVRRHVISRPSVMAWMRRAFAGSFVLLGGRLLLAEQ